MNKRFIFCSITIYTKQTTLSSGQLVLTSPSVSTLADVSTNHVNAPTMTAVSLSTVIDVYVAQVAGETCGALTGEASVRVMTRAAILTHSWVIGALINIICAKSTYKQPIRCVFCEQP